MRKSVALLILLALMAIMVQPALSVKFSIYVYDNDGNPVSGAYVSIWQNNNLLDSGNSDAQGLFTAYLSDGTEYKIRAEKGSLWDEKEKYVPNSQDTSTINMRLHS
ncbi:MAG TPA: carboxypeptidase-like regulatory domain-containing protein [Methanotrichaceae archaeon]|nr:carboxypeptidase-like regulatory domain-containing protein [Methanotrichaceae archaeon]